MTNPYANETLWIEQGKPVTQRLAGPRALFEFMGANEGKVTDMWHQHAEHYGNAQCGSWITPDEWRHVAAYMQMF